jgi:hypothetical protein
MPKDDRGRLWLESIGIWLATDGQKVICYDGETDEPIGDYRQTRQQFLEARREAEVERVRTEAAQGRAEAERVRAEAERMRAEAAQASAEAEKARADAEAQARQADAVRLRELEAELARLRGQTPPT